MKVHEYTVTEEEILQFKKRKYVRRMTDRAITRGDLIRAECCGMCCKNRPTQAHHIDYGKPFDVRWLCSKCHGKVHRRDHEWNPENNEQSPLPVELNSVNLVTVTFTIPAKNFLAMREEASIKGVGISTLLKEEALVRFKVKSRQLEFNFEENMNDKPQQIRNQRVQSVVKDEVALLQSKSATIQKIRSKRNLNLRAMEGELFPVSGGYGSHSAELQRTYAY